MNRGASAPLFFTQTTIITGLMPQPTDTERYYALALMLGIEAETEERSLECVEIAQDVGSSLTPQKRYSIRKKIEGIYSS